MLHPLPVTRLGGVGPATAERLHQVGVRTVADLAARSLTDLVALAGRAHGTGLYALARAEDDRRRRRPTARRSRCRPRRPSSGT